MTDNSVKVAAGINVYNDCHSLERTLSTTVEHFDRIYVVDGRYPDYGIEGDSKYSTDFTKELVQCFENCKYIPYFAQQKDKRTRYLKECKYDFLVVIDADEYMIVDSWPTFQDQLQRNILNMPMRARFHQYQINYQSEPTKYIPLARLIYKPQQLIYTTHWTLIEDPVVDSKAVMSVQMIEGITICTDDLLRPYSRLQQDISYQWQLFLKEKVISEKVFNDPECKANFAKHIIWEVSIWKEHKDKIEAQEKLLQRVKGKRL